MPNNRQYRQFDINTIEDALVALNALISSAIPNIRKFDEYNDEVKDMVHKHENDSYISAKEYDDIHDRVLFRQRELIALMADDASNILSYKHLRKMFIDKGFITRDLDLSITQTINELHTIRNATFHNVQSRLVAEKEAMEKSIPPKLAGLVKVQPQLNPIIIPNYEKYSIYSLISFLKHNDLRSEQFHNVLNEMKKDYQDMYDKLSNAQQVIVPGSELLVGDTKSKTPVRISVIKEAFDAAGHPSDVANLSMAIQKGKYDGSKESYDKYTGNN